MKWLPFSCAVLTALIASSADAAAGQLIYRSIGRQTLYGNGQITRLTARGFLVFDPAIMKGTAIVGFTLNGNKLYSVVPLENYRVDQVSGPNGSTYTIMAKAESPGTQFQGVLLEAVYLRGKNEGLDMGPAGGAGFPRVFASSARAVSQNPQTNKKVAGEVVGSYVLDAKATVTSNQLETFDQAVTRLSNGFAGRGYTQFFPTPAP
jgi:hypothetical protein